MSSSWTEVTRHRVASGNQARQPLVAGATKLGKAVGSTLGPAGQVVVIERPGQVPLVTKDGVTVAKAINLRDPMERLGADLVREVAQKTNEVGGDGTTTATVLACAILEQGHKALSTGHSPTKVKTGIEKAATAVVTKLRSLACPVASRDDVSNIGTISANGDRDIGELLATAIAKVGKDGTITVEPAKSTKTSLEFVDGFQLETGFWSPYFITQPAKGVANLEDCYVWVTNRKVSTIQEVLPVVEQVHKTGKPLLMVVDEIEQEPLSLLITNKMKGTLNVCVVKAPYYGEYRSDVLGDLAAVCGGEVFDSSNPKALKEATLSQLGRAARIQVGRQTTLVVARDVPEIQARVQTRIQSIQDGLQNGVFQDPGHLDRVKLRLARMSGGVAVIRVGGVTEPEILEKKDRVDDALNATVAATQEGIVPGGGVALWHSAEALLRETRPGVEGDEDIGWKILLLACKAPLERIVENAGQSPAVVSSRLAESSSPEYGYDASTGRYTNMVEAGIIDPVKVTRTALENAASVASLLLMCNTVVVADSTHTTENQGVE